MAELWRSTSVRLALLSAGIFILSSLLLVGFFWWRTTLYLDREVDAVILADTRAIGDRLQDFGLGGAIETIRDRVNRGGDARAIYLLTDPGLNPIAGNLSAWPLSLGRATGWHQINLASQDQLHATRILYVALPGGFQLLVGRDVEERAKLRSAILDSLGWSGLFAGGLAIIGGLLLRRAIFARVLAIDGATQMIIKGDLSSRLPSGNSSDEFDRLAQTINIMLQQIDLLVEGVRGASNAVAHELRTPLAELRSRLEGVLTGIPPVAGLAGEIAGAIEDLDHIIAIFNALMRLAEIESGARVTGFRQCDLAAITAEAVELYAPFAEEKGLSLGYQQEGAAFLTGDPFLFAQAIANLIDNAIKYTRASGHVQIRLARPNTDHLALSVSDNGPGIPEVERARATQRFFRGEASRAIPGAGLGLSLVERVVTLHGGRLTLEDAEPGLTATILLPIDANRYARSA